MYNWFVEYRKNGELRTGYVAAKDYLGALTEAVKKFEVPKEDIVRLF